MSGSRRSACVRAKIAVRRGAAPVCAAPVCVIGGSALRSAAAPARTACVSGLVEACELTSCGRDVVVILAGEAGGERVVGVRQPATAEQRAYAEAVRRRAQFGEQICQREQHPPGRPLATQKGDVGDGGHAREKDIAEALRV